MNIAAKRFGGVVAACSDSSHGMAIVAPALLNTARRETLNFDIG
jgi:hypothetical protein